MSVFTDRTRESSTTTGTGTLTTSGVAPSGYQTFATAGLNGKALDYCIEAVDANNVPTGEWEVGRGVYTTSGSTLTRVSILNSSNSDAAVNFSAGTKNVFVTASGKSFPGLPSHCFETFWDAASIPSTNVSEAWNVQSANSGTVTLVASVLQNNAVGYAALTTVTSATSRCSVSGGNGVIKFGNGQAYWRSRQQLGSLSDGTDTFSVRAGFHEAPGTSVTDGAFFRYTHSVNGGRWEAVTANNSAETATDTGVTAVAGTDLLFEITVNAAGTSVEFKINSAVVATNTTNIPTGANRETGYGFAAVRTVGTTSKVGLNVDYGYVRVDFTVTR